MHRIFLTTASVVLLLLTANPAGASESQLEPTWIRVEAGDHLELTGDVSQGEFGWVGDGPFFAYLAGEEYGTTMEEGLGGSVTDVPLGELNIVATGNHASVSISFTLPEDAPSGEYLVAVCNDPCTTGFGDLDSTVLYVGMDPPPPAQTEPATKPPPATTQAVAVGLTETTESATQSRGIHLTLATQPARSNGLAPAWMAISAALAAGVLVTILLTRRWGDQ